MIFRDDFTGRKFGRLTAVEFKTVRNRNAWRCVCECGKFVTVLGQNLRKGYTRSCGCLNSEVRKELDHGHSKPRTPTYHSWDGIIQRCTNPGCSAFKHYGGRGIKVCKRWMTFANFLEDMGVRPHGKTIERKDNDAGYSKENCRWATQAEQVNNRRNNIRVTIGEVTLTLSQWAVRNRINYATVYGRVRDGWSPLDAVTRPVSR